MKECKKSKRGCLNICEDAICPVIEYLNNCQELRKLDYVKSIRKWT
jgi:hypothetical protein